MLRIGLFIYFFIGFWQISLANPILSIQPEQGQYFIKPFFQFYQDTIDLTDIDAIPTFIPNAPFQPIGETRGYGKGKYWVKLDLDTSQSQDSLFLVSETNNYWINAFVFYQDTNENWLRKTYHYDQAVEKRNPPKAFAAFSIPVLKKVQTIYLCIQSDITTSPEFRLLTPTGFNNYQKGLDRFAIIYLVIIGCMLLFALLTGLFFKLSLPIYFAFYSISTAILVLLEIGWIGEQMFPQHPAFLFQLNILIIPITILALLSYAAAFFKTSPMTPLWRKAFRILMILCLVQLPLSLLFIQNSWINELFISFIGYAAVPVILVTAFQAIQSNHSVAWFIAGTVIVMIALVLSDWQIRNIIQLNNWQNVVYAGILLDFLLIGIGTFFTVKRQLTQLQNVQLENLQLQQNLKKLENQRDKARAAFEVLANKKSMTSIQAPPEYFDNPLSNRELQVLLLLTEGLSNAEIGEQMHLSRNTIKTHLKRIYAKLNTNSRDETIRLSKKYGLI